MPGRLTSKMYDALVQRIERMADGIALHKGEDGFPKALDEAKRRAVRQELENLRGRYEAALKAAEKLYEPYSDAYKSAEELMARDDELVRGIYGKFSLTVADFGTKVLSAKRARKNSKPQAKA